MIAIINPQIEGVHGIARYLRSFLKDYPADGPEILMISGEKGLPIPAPANVRFHHIPLAKNRFGLLTWTLQVSRHLRLLAQTGNLQAINFHIPPLIPALLVPKVAPFIVTAHTTYLGMSGDFYSPRQFKGQWSKASILIKKAIEKRIFAKADLIIALTEQGRQEIERYGYRGPIKVEPNGVDIAQFQPSQISDKTIDVVFAGRIEKRKGSRPMVDAVRRLIALRPAIRICIIGAGDDDEYVKSGLAGIEQVLLTGRIPFDEVSSILKQSRVYASTSYYEGLPGTCIEAMAMRLPAVVWNFPFYDGLVTEGVTGHLAPPNDIDGFATAVLNLIDAPGLAFEMGAAARALAEHKYDWADLSRRLAVVLAAHARTSQT
ncbi:glycosyltransferase family 4 protein [Sphingomonas faeni]|uniref:glycosyltransferase family 4 protein n=1 Tax=Sphingomonas faeni TaxID=185950 RepID=UPI0033605D0D